MEKNLQHQLLTIAHDSIQSKFETGHPLAVDLAGLSGELVEDRASFVTLTLQGELRGCIGMIEPCRPLAVDVAENACEAAFADPRFDPLSPEEFEQTEIHISVLSLPESMTFSSEEELLAQVRPGVDGLILQEGFRRSTFLPSVWEQIPDPVQFLTQLKMKAGLPGNYWSDTLNISRYTAEYFPS